jgi:hypothetical protein
MNWHNGNRLSFVLHWTGEFCDGLCHLTAGVKVTDLRAIDLKDGSLLSSIDDGLVG